MRRTVVVGILICGVFIGLSRPFVAQENNPSAANRRNVIIFVADGLRPGSVNEQDTPTLWYLRTHGVNFTNSHSLFPTFTTANASAIATGHELGDTGDFSNTIWAGYATFDTGNFDLPVGSPTPFVENDQVLADLDDHYHGNYLSESTLLVTAAQHGYNTASIGKLGPTAIQQIEVLSPTHQQFPLGNPTIVIDDSTGTSAGLPLRPGLADELVNADLSIDAPLRTNGYAPPSFWNNALAGTHRPNTVQQQWFADVTTKAILPEFARDSTTPFLILFWSRDPDGTQHNQNDSSGGFSPGINGPTSKLALQNADRNLHQILDWLDLNPALKAQTDIFVTSDHGFATISRREITRTARPTDSESAKHNYVDTNGNIDTRMGTLPTGFLAIDLALKLNANLFDPDRRSIDHAEPYRQLKLGPDVFERPLAGNGLIGDVVKKQDGSDAKVIVAGNGGSDLIYVPDKNADAVRQIVQLLTTFDYVGGIFVDDRYGTFPGALPLTSIGLVGSTPLPRPAIAVAFRVFYTDPRDLQTAIQVSDTALHEGQGMHGGFGRDSTFNNMAAIGPDFKTGFDDLAPVSNADIAPTIAHILGFELPAHGTLTGRVIAESLSGSNAKPTATSNHIASAPADGWQTILHYQELEGKRYYDRACFVQAAKTTQDAVCP
jgi:arylsulfatase A-like enzyme